MISLQIQRNRWKSSGSLASSLAIKRNEEGNPPYNTREWVTLVNHFFHSYENYDIVDKYIFDEMANNIWVDGNLDIWLPQQTGSNSISIAMQKKMSIQKTATQN